MERFALLLSCDEVGLAKELLPYYGNLELHNIHGQCASLISKDIINLTQLFIKRGTLIRNMLISKRAKHHSIFFYEVFLE